MDFLIVFAAVALGGMCIIAVVAVVYTVKKHNEQYEE